LYEVRLPADSAIVAVLRDGHVVIPQPETVLAAGDEVVALTAPVSESQLRTMVVGDVEGSSNHGGERGRQPSHGLDGAGSI
jgi:trk system potassium uptake protein TrkA